MNNNKTATSRSFECKTEIIEKAPIKKKQVKHKSCCSVKTFE